MKLSICTDVFGKISLTEMLDKVVAYGLDAVELAAGAAATSSSPLRSTSTMTPSAKHF